MFLFWLRLQIKKQCGPSSGDICDQRILQSIWLKAFPPITEEQEFPPDMGLNSKKDNNIKYYLSTFPAKINFVTKFKKIKKPLFLGPF